MPRKPRITVINAPHHIFHQSLGGRAIFTTDRDCLAYLEILAENAWYYKLDILAWCIMKNHVNLVAVPRRKNSLARAVGRTNFSYTHYLNQRRRRSGQIWRNRFQSCALDDSFMKLAVRYVETLPVRNRLVRKPEKYTWSSAQAHLTGQDSYELLALDLWPPPGLRKQWAQFLSQKLTDAEQQTLRTYTQTGRPLGAKSFIEKLEKKFRRRLAPLPIGRPRKDI